MTKPNIQPVAVFTGDLVGSTNLTKAQIDAAFAALEDCARHAETWCEAPLNFTRHRGDGWQVMLQQPKYVPRLATVFRATLKALGNDFDTYIGIATGTVDESGQRDLNRRNDQVFINSGHALEAVKSVAQHGIRMGHNGSSIEAAAITLLDKIVSEWTPVQAEAIAEMLHSMGTITYTELAEKLNKSRQAVTKSLSAAGHIPIDIAIICWEKDYD